MGGSSRNGWGVRFERSLWEPEVINVHESFTETLSMEGKYAVKLSITDHIKISRKLRKRYNGRLWKMQMWSDSRWQLDNDSNVASQRSYNRSSSLINTRPVV